MRVPRSRRSRRSGSAILSPKDPQLLVTEYVLNQDATPLYREYIQDSRIGATEKAELTAAYRYLQPTGEPIAAI